MIEATSFLEGLRRLDRAWFAGVPCSYLTALIDRVIDDPQLAWVSSANEGDAVAQAAGATIGGRPGVALMQNSGLGNAVNPLTSLVQTFRIPLLLVLTLRGDPERGDEPQHEIMGRITTGLLESMEIAWRFLPTEPEELDGALEAAREELLGRGKSFAFVVRKGSVARGAPSTARPPARSAGRHELALEGLARGERPSRGEALERVLAGTPVAGTVVVATTGHTGRELYALADRPNHLYMVGSMGCASALGLGLSLARPDLRVVVVDGDGALLMRMGNLATIGAYGEGNLVHVVLDNGVHESTGAQATVSPSVSFAGCAAACGYVEATESDDARAIDRLLAGDGDGPRLLHLRTRPGSPSGLPRPEMAPHEVRERLEAHLRAPAATEGSRA